MMDNGTRAQRQTERQARLFLVYVKHEKKGFCLNPSHLLENVGRDMTRRMGRRAVEDMSGPSWFRSHVFVYVCGQLAIEEVQSPSQP